MPALLMKSRRLKSTTTRRSPLLTWSMTTDSNERTFPLSSRPTGDSTKTSSFRSSATSISCAAFDGR